MAGLIHPSEMKTDEVKAHVHRVKTYHGSFTDHGTESVLGQLAALIEDAAAKGFDRAWSAEVSSDYPGSQVMLTFKAHGAA